MTQEQKLKEAQKIQDSLMKGFPAIARAIAKAQSDATKKGYTETILGRRRHHPNMQLPKFEFEPMEGYVNPDIDPLDPESLKNKEQIPKRIVDALKKEFDNLKWYGKIVKRTKELADQKIKVINNSYKIEEASRQCFNCVDKETEILTVLGWRKYNEINNGDKILSYSIERNQVEEDSILAVHIYNEPTEVVDFEMGNFSASSTLNHRWITQKSGRPIAFKTTEEIAATSSPSFPIIRVADNKLAGSAISDADLTILGWLDPEKHDWAKLQCVTPREFTFKFVSQLSQKQSKILLEAMLATEDQVRDIESIDKETLICKTERKVDVLQYLIFKAGFASSVAKTETGHYAVTLSTARRASVCGKHSKRRTATDGVWCVTTNNQTWIARRHGVVYITGNSVIQGSAADLTKMAMLRLEHDDEWAELNGNFLLPVHDELICEVPIENAEKGAEVLSKCMCAAGDFLPFKLTTDVETTFRWYGLSVEDVNEFDRPDLLDYDLMTESNIAWIQCMLIENEYLMPVYKNPDGSKPKGIKAKGVNGILSDELKAAVEDYKKRYNLQTDQQFLDHIEAKVTRGVLLDFSK